MYVRDVYDPLHETWRTAKWLLTEMSIKMSLEEKNIQPLYYIYPMNKKISFSLISKQHIKYLSKKIKIHEIDEVVIDGLVWTTKRRILLHPILYITIGDKPEMFSERVRRLKTVKKVAEKLGGFETCDSDAISKVATYVLNQFDLIFVPSNFAKKVLEKCGVQSPIEVLPHGIPEEFMRIGSTIISDNIKPILDIKEKHDAILVLFFLMHSGYRKGADLVYKVMKRVQERYKNVYLVVKRGDIIDPYLIPLRSLKTIEITGFLSTEELRQLYDACDILLCPSRGGGFEMNALEGISRGLPTIVPNAGCFLDYIQFAIPVNAPKKVKVFNDNPIHVGYGWEVDLEEFYRVVCDVIDHLPEYKERFAKVKYVVHQKYSWKHICDRLYELLKKHGFVD